MYLSLATCQEKLVFIQYTGTRQSSLETQPQPLYKRFQSPQCYTPARAVGNTELQPPPGRAGWLAGPTPPRGPSFSLLLRGRQDMGRVGQEQQDCPRGFTTSTDLKISIIKRVVFFFLIRPTRTLRTKTQKKTFS